MPALVLILSEMAMNASFIAGVVIGARVAIFCHQFIKRSL